MSRNSDEDTHASAIFDDGTSFPRGWISLIGILSSTFFFLYGLHTMGRSFSFALRKFLNTCFDLLHNRARGQRVDAGAVYVILKAKSSRDEEEEEEIDTHCTLRVGYYRMFGRYLPITVHCQCKEFYP